MLGSGSRENKAALDVNTAFTDQFLRSIYKDGDVAMLAERRFDET